MKKIDLKTWLHASPSERQNYLQSGIELDNTSRLCLRIKIELESYGANIPEEAILKYWENRKHG